MTRAWIALTEGEPPEPDPRPSEQQASQRAPRRGGHAHVHAFEHCSQGGDALRAHSGPLMSFIEWRPTANRNVEVLNDTADLYRYFDCTRAAESAANPRLVRPLDPVVPSDRRVLA